MKSLKFLRDSFDNKISVKDIIKLIDMLAIENGLDDYIDIVSIDDNNTTHGTYYPNDKRLIINPNVISEFTNNWYLKKEFDKSDTTFNRVYNLFLLETIYHEINHVKQTREADKNINDSLHKIIKEGIELAKRMPDKLTFDEEIIYKYYYLNVLIERNAEIMSLYTLIDNNNRINIFTKTELLYLKENLINFVRFGYHGKVNPVYTYYNLRKKSKEYKEINFNKEYNLITTLSWGLPITGKIDDKVKELKMSINV